MKKILFFIITIFIFVILFCVFSTTNKQLTKDEFISLIKSFEHVSNVKLEGNTTKYIKDEYMLSIREDGLYTWTNSQTKECIGYFPASKIYSFLDYSNGEITGLENSKYTFIRL